MTVRWMLSAFGIKIEFKFCGRGVLKALGAWGQFKFNVISI